MKTSPPEAPTAPLAEQLPAATCCRNWMYRPGFAEAKGPGFRFAEPKYSAFALMRPRSIRRIKKTSHRYRLKNLIVKFMDGDLQMTLKHDVPETGYKTSFHRLAF